MTPTRTNQHRRKLAGLALSAALVAAACASDDDGPTASTDVPAVTSDAAANEAVSTEAPVTEPATTEATETVDSDPVSSDESETDVEGEALPDDLPAPYAAFYNDNGGLRYASVNESNMAYVEVGDPNGPVILLVHGLPASNFLWREVIDELGTDHRIIAPDLIGYGLSDKPDIEYSFSTVSDYLEGFIDELALTDINLVVHDIGGPAGLGYAGRNGDNVASLTMFETLWLPIDDLADSNYAPPFQELLLGMKTEGVGEQIVVVDNTLLELAQQLSVTELTDEEIASYRYPWNDEADRYILLDSGGRSIPVGGEPADSVALFDNYVEWLETSDTPKLVIAADPGAISPSDYVDEAVERFSNTTRGDIEGAGHFVQEDKPGELAALILSNIG